MRFGIMLALALFSIAGLQGQTQLGAASKAPQSKSTAKPAMKHPHLHHALWALHHALHELKESKEDYAGHKEKAEKEIHHAIKSIDVILKHENDNHHPVPTKHELTEAHKKYKHHPHLHHAIHEVKEAHHQLKESKDDFGGNRAKALHDMHKAVHNIELVLKHAQANKSTTTGKVSPSSKNRTSSTLVKG